MADYEWSWPTKIEREVIERALTLDFVAEARNLVLVGRNGLGKTMIAQNICHAAVLAGYSVLFRSAAILDELQRQSPEGRRSKLRTYANAGLSDHAASSTYRAWPEGNAIQFLVVVAIVLILESHHLAPGVSL